MKMKRHSLLKTTLCAVLSTAMALSLQMVPVSAENPVVQTIYTADPSPIVVGDTVYLYTTHDELREKNYGDWSYMNDWRCYSSTDMVNWTDLGQIAHAETFNGNGNWRAWAQDAVEMPIKQKDGTWVKKYFLICPFNGTKIDVAVSDHPWGPFTDATPGKYLIDGGWGGGNIDPSVYIEDHGNPDDYENYDVYLYWGNPYLRYCKLTNDLLDVDPDTNGDGVVSGNENQIDSRFSNEDNKILGQVRPGLHSFNTYGNEGYKSFGEPSQGNNSTGKFPNDSGPEQKRCAFEEGPWLYKHDDGKANTDDYFLFFVGGRTPGETVEYSTAPTPIGPWTYRALLMDREYGYSCIHPGVIDYKGKSYLFYLNQILIGGDGSNRSVCVKEFKYDSNNLIIRETSNNTRALMVQGKDIKLNNGRAIQGQSFFSVDPTGTLNPYKLNEAETICWESNFDSASGGYNGSPAGVETRAKGKCTDRDDSTGKEAFWKAAALYGVCVCDIDNNDYIKVREVDFGDKGPIGFTATLASGSGENQQMPVKDKNNNTVMIPNPFATTYGGTLEVWLDYENNSKKVKLGSIDVGDTGGVNEFKEFSFEMEEGSVTGVHDLYFIGKGAGGKDLFNFDTWKFDRVEPEPDPETEATPTPTTSTDSDNNGKNDPTDSGNKGNVEDDNNKHNGNDSNNSGVISKVIETVIYVDYPINLAKPKIKKISKGSKKATIKLKKVKNATGYKIYLADKKKGKFAKKLTVKNLTATLKKIKAGKNYYVKVKAYAATSDGTVVYSKFSKVKRFKL